MVTPRIQRIDAVVLKANSFRETSLIGSLLSRQQGRIGFISRGARRPGTSAAAALQPTNLVSCSVYLGSGAGLRTVTGVETARVHEMIARVPVLLGLASYGCELVMAQLPEEDPAPGIYALLKGYLSALNEASAEEAERARLAFDFRMQQSLGYALRIDACARCGATITTASTFSLEHGGLMCPACMNQDACHEALVAGDLDVLRAMLTEPFSRWRRRPVSHETIARLARIARGMWDHHSPARVRSKSLSFLA